GCASNSPANPIGAASLWALDPWTLEYIVTDAALRQYGSLINSVSYTFIVPGAAKIDVEAAPINPPWTPGGWVKYDTVAGLGSPPDDQEVWESMAEIAQRALHIPPGFTLNEGAVNPTALIEDIPLGLTGEEAAEQIRPFLQAQASLVSELILGD